MSDLTCLWCHFPLERDDKLTRVARCVTPSCGMSGKAVTVPPTRSGRYRELAEDLSKIINDIDPTGEVRKSL